MREQQWRLGTEEASENSWSFSRELSAEELLRYTKEETRPRTVAWTGGSVFVQVATTEIDGGYTRAIVRARFRGYGESRDKFAMQRKWWPLDSNGGLEASIADMLKKHFNEMR